MLVTGNEIVNFSNMEILCTYARCVTTILFRSSYSNRFDISIQCEIMFNLSKLMTTATFLPDNHYLNTIFHFLDSSCETVMLSEAQKLKQTLQIRLALVATNRSNVQNSTSELNISSFLLFFFLFIFFVVFFSFFSILKKILHRTRIHDNKIRNIIAYRIPHDEYAHALMSIWSSTLPCILMDILLYLIYIFIHSISYIYDTYIP